MEESSMQAFRKTATALIVAWGTAGLSMPSQAQGIGAGPFVGAWQLVSFKATAGGQVSYPLGEKPGGYVGFTPGRFWVMLIDSTRKAPAAAAPTDAEAGIQMKTHAAYTGKYVADPTPTPDGIKITIRVDAASNHAINATDRVLYVRVDGTKLTLTSPAIVVPTSGLTSVVQLEFVKAD
jgi:Lipocalin-like domain